ncbi:MAG TPA: 16S rRNA (guanine(966)-N(2))-methyltransferase RsmD [Marmoricola sp.]|nr:16S rRNA (guanine(966)-N(2))-methyltransferase RsmD [Marmoricola sp.]
MSRIIGGEAGGRRIQTPGGTQTRPTTDRVREALFSALEARLGSLRGLRFLDLYAGSGAVGLEALSRGAGVLTAVESDRRTARLAQQNARTLGPELGRRAEVLAQPVGRVLATPPRAPYDVVFADPPYALPEQELTAVLADLVDNHWTGPGTVLVLERSSRSPEPAWPGRLTGVKQRNYGETTLWYVQQDLA